MSSIDDLLHRGCVYLRMAKTKRADGHWRADIQCPNGTESWKTVCGGSGVCVRVCVCACVRACVRTCACVCAASSAPSMVCVVCVCGGVGMLATRNQQVTRAPYI